MKRTVFLLALLLAVAAPVVAGPKTDTITTKAGRTFFDCKVTHVYPDGVGFIHRNGAARIAFKDLPDNLRKEFRYDPAKEAEYIRQQAAERAEEKQRAKLHEIMMEERLAEAKMAEASYLAAANESSRAPTLISPLMPSEAAAAQATSVQQTPSWVGAPITGPALGGSAYRASSYSRWRNPAFFPLGGYYSGFGYPYYGGYSYGYPYGGYYGTSYLPVGGYMRPTVFGQWNVGHGIHLGVGLGSFGFHGFGCR